MLQNLSKGIYKHYKGNFYQVIGVAKHSETLEELVVYKPIYNHDHAKPEQLWVRPLKMFTETININGTTVCRFEPVKVNN